MLVDIHFAALKFGRPRSVHYFAPPLPARIGPEAAGGARAPGLYSANGKVPGFVYYNDPSIYV